MTIAESRISCGVKELSGLRHPPKILLHQVKAQWEKKGKYSKFASVVFSDVDQPLTLHTGKSFASFIEENQLGGVYTSLPKKNPNSRNRIQTWIWNVDMPAVLKYLKENRL